MPNDRRSIPAEMDARQMIVQGYSSPGLISGPRFAGAAPVSPTARPVAFSAPGAMNSQAWGRVATADYGGMAREQGRRMAQAITPNDYEAGVLAKANLRWNPGSGQAERVGANLGSMMAARPGARMAPVSAASPSPSPALAPAPGWRPPAVANGPRTPAESEARVASGLAQLQDAMEKRIGARAGVMAGRPGVNWGNQRPEAQDPRAMAMDTARRAFQESAARYGGAGRGMVNLAGLEAGQEFDRAQDARMLAQRQLDMEQARIDIARRQADSQLPGAAQMELEWMRAGGVPGVDAKAFAARHSPQSASPAPGIGVRLPQVNGLLGLISPPGAAPPAPSPSPVDNEVALINNAPRGVLDALAANQRGDAESTLLRLADQGVDFRANPALAQAVRAKLLESFGVEGLSEATVDPTGKPYVSPMEYLGGGTNGLLGGTKMRPPVMHSGDLSGYPWLARTLLHPVNYMMGGAGTRLFGDPNYQVNQRNRAIATWKALGGP